MIKELKTLKLYERPAYFFGTDFFEYYTVIAQTRDSDCLTRSNFDAMIELLGGESKKTNAVYIARFNHWACGWVEVIFIHRGASKKLQIADKVMTEVKENYPVIDDELFSEYENEEKNQYWNSLSLKEKIEMCAQHNESIFAARHDYIPGDIDQYINV